jgi:IS30 family transposase
MKKIATELTFSERKEIEKYNKKGWSCQEIAIHIGRSKNAVVTDIRRAGGALFYTAKGAQNIADATKAEKYRKLSERNKGNKITFKMKERIENLEMQVEILYDTIKELINDQKN